MPPIRRTWRLSGLLAAEELIRSLCLDRRPLISPVRQPRLDRCGCLLSIKRQRIVVATPLDERVVLLVFRVSQSFEIPVEARDTAHVFRRTGPFAFDAERVLFAGFLLGTALEQDLVFPAIPGTWVSWVI